MVKDKVGRSQVSLQSSSLCNVILIPFSALTQLGDRKAIRPVKIRCWFIDGDNLTGALHVL